MIALPGAFGGLHLPEQGIHFGNAEPAIGAHRAMTGHGRQQGIALLGHAPGGAMLTQIGQDVPQQGLDIALGQQRRHAA